MYKLGIVGGMGPKATAEFFTRIVDNTKATTDQEHIEICIINNPKIPDRTNHLKNTDLSPLDPLMNSIADLIKLNARVLVMPCNSSHYYVNLFEIPKDILFINMIKETIIYIDKYHPNSKIIILGTYVVNFYRLYEGYNNLKRNNNKILYPLDDEQIMIEKIIRQTKAGVDYSSVLNSLNNLITVMQEKYLNAVFVFACTELSCYSMEFKKAYKIIDPMDILAFKAIEACGYKSKYDLFQ